MSKLSLALSAVITVASVTAATPSLCRYYVTHIPLSGLSNSPFDSYLAKSLFTMEEMDALQYAKANADGELSIERGATIIQVVEAYRARNARRKATTASRDWHPSKLSAYSICAENDSTVCMVLTPDSNLAYLTGTKEATSQRCDVLVTYAGGRANVGKHAAFSEAGAITFYGPRTVGSRQAMAIIRNSGQFLINYTCEFGSYGTYSFKTQKPLSEINKA